MMLRRKAKDVFHVLLSPHIQCVAIILHWKRLFQRAHMPLLISRLRLKQQSAYARNSIRHCTKALHRLVAERSNLVLFQARGTCATCLRTRFDCGVARYASWLTNQHREGVGGQSQLQKKISLSLFSVSAS